MKGDKSSAKKSKAGAKKSVAKKGMGYLGNHKIDFRKQNKKWAAAAGKKGSTKKSAKAGKKSTTKKTKQPTKHYGDSWKAALAKKKSSNGKKAGKKPTTKKTKKPTKQYGASWKSALAKKKSAKGKASSKKPAAKKIQKKVAKKLTTKVPAACKKPASKTTRCGTGHGRCADPKASCSRFGWCGTSPAHRSGSQKAFNGIKCPKVAARRRLAAEKKYTNASTGLDTMKHPKVWATNLKSNRKSLSTQTDNIIKAHVAAKANNVKSGVLLSEEKKIIEQVKTATTVLVGLQGKTAKVRSDKAANFKPLPKVAFTVKAQAAAPKAKKSAPKPKSAAKTPKGKKF